MTDCIFCKIIKGDIPCEKVYEDSKVLAFLDISPINKGHTLVIPKKHCTNLLDMPDDDLKHIAVVLKKVANAVKQAVGADGINLDMNNGSTTGQFVMHAHFHIIPRFSNDGLEAWPRGKYGNGEISKYADKIKSSLKSL